MPRLAQRRFFAAIALALFAPAATAQAPPPAPAPPAPAPAPPAAEVPAAHRDWVGSWSGSARIENEGPLGPCAYVGPAKPPAVTLDLRSEGGALKGTLKLVLPALTVPGCPAIERVAEVNDLTANGSSLAFFGPDANTWTLGRRGRDLLGTVASRGPGTEAMLRMSGEVSLTLGGGAGKRGSAVGAVAGILAANVVGLGAFAAANKLGQGKDQAPPQVNCSPRQCFFLSAAEPCQCNTPNVSGGTCGTTTSGVAYAGLCNADTGLPCQAGLSCNSGFCEDRFGHCPF